MSQPLLSAASILAAEDLKEENVPVPEWNGNVRLMQLNAEESTAFTKEMSTIEGAENGMYLMLIYCARDAEGKRIFTLEDLPALKKKNITVLNRLQLIALELNGMSVRGQAALKKD